MKNFKFKWSNGTSIEMAFGSVAEMWEYVDDITRKKKGCPVKIIGQNGEKIIR